MLKRSRLAIAVSLSAAVLCGCGGAAEPAVTADSARPSPTAAKDRKHQFEAAKADCMKQKGFTYVPYVQPEDKSEEVRKRDSGDYQAMRKYRARYGFGVFAAMVYPKELEGAGSDLPVADPNIKIQGQLSAAQLGAYGKGKDACLVTVGKEVLGLTVKSYADYYKQLAKAHRTAKESALNGDPELVELATSMAACLKGKGYAVSDTKPRAMSNSGEDVFTSEMDKIGRKQKPGLSVSSAKDTSGEIWVPTLTPAQAKPYLNREIKAALDDLECGKDFYAAYAPKDMAIQRKINDQFAW
ncbi:MULTISPECIES: hypothetical protein [unclassified Nonomuraea]|uniref:hypothetical protein n=1 Tax=unclassified Nonomuraea TaxID=2593643 RepID=UPI0033DC7E84